MDIPYRVIITVPPGAKNITSRVEGVSGPKCAEAARWLHNFGTITHVEDTEEAYLHETTEVSNDETVETGDKW